MAKIQAVLVYNPKSGKGLAAIRAQNFSDAWKTKFGTDLILRPTTSRADISTAVKEHRKRTIILMGGDGTLSEGLQGLAEANSFKPLKSPIGLLPGGTGNSFLREFGLHEYLAAKEALL